MKRIFLNSIAVIAGLVISANAAGQSAVVHDSSNNNGSKKVVKRLVIHTDIQQGDSVYSQTIEGNSQEEIDSILKTLMPQIQMETNFDDSAFSNLNQYKYFIPGQAEIDSMMRNLDQEFILSLQNLGNNFQPFEGDDSIFENFDLQFDPLNFDHFSMVPPLPENFRQQLDSVLEQQYKSHLNDSGKRIIIIKDDGDHITLERNGEMVYIDKKTDVDNVDNQIEYETNDKGQKVIVVKTRIVLQDVSPEEADQLKKQGIKTSNKEPEFDYLRFYPNPAENMINIEFKTTKPTDTKVIISDLLGKTLYEEKLNGFSGEFTRQVDLSQYGSGTYILQIIQGRKAVTRKIMVD